MVEFLAAQAVVVGLVLKLVHRRNVHCLVFALLRFQRFALRRRMPARLAEHAGLGGLLLRELAGPFLLEDQQPAHLGLVTFGLDGHDLDVITLDRLVEHCGVLCGHPVLSSVVGGVTQAFVHDLRRAERPITDRSGTATSWWHVAVDRFGLGRFGRLPACVLRCQRFSHEVGHQAAT
jgi:hypothetical protein